MASDESTNVWQGGFWDTMSERYVRELDQRFAPVGASVIARADLAPGQSALDIGTGAGTVAIESARIVGPEGDVTGIDVSDEMLRLAEARLVDQTNIMFRQGSAEAIPAVDGSFHVVLASLVMMFVPDRAAAAREIARVLRPGGRFVASVWAGQEECDISKFQVTAGLLAPGQHPPAVGPAALADPSPFLLQLKNAGIDASVESEVIEFEFDTFGLAWDTLAAVTVGDMEPERIKEAKLAVQDAMWPKGEGPRHFRNLTQFIVGNKL